MKITYTKCCTPRGVKLQNVQAGRVVRFGNCISDIDGKDPCLVVDMRSYTYQLEDMGCEKKVGVINLRTNKLSIIARHRVCYPFKEVEICIHDD